MSATQPLDPAHRTGPGRPFPLGPTICEEGTNFSLFSANATMVELVLFNGVDDVAPSRTVEFDNERNRTSHYWHMLVCGITPGQLYGFSSSRSRRSCGRSSFRQPEGITRPVWPKRGRGEKLQPG